MGQPRSQPAVPDRSLARTQQGVVLRRETPHNTLSYSHSELSKSWSVLRSLRRSGPMWPETRPLPQTSGG